MVDSSDSYRDTCLWCLARLKSRRVVESPTTARELSFLQALTCASVMILSHEMDSCYQQDLHSWWMVTGSFCGCGCGRAWQRGLLPFTLGKEAAGMPCSTGDIQAPRYLLWSRMAGVSAPQDLYRAEFRLYWQKRFLTQNLQPKLRCPYLQSIKQIKSTMLGLVRESMTLAEDKWPLCLPWLLSLPSWVYSTAWYLCALCCDCEASWDLRQLCGRSARFLSLQWFVHWSSPF